MPDLPSFAFPRSNVGPLPRPAPSPGARQQTETPDSPRGTEAVPPLPRTEAVPPVPRTEAVPPVPRTEAVRRALRAGGGGLTADLVFLEAWERQAPPDIAATLRAAQIRRANRSLAAEIRAELRRGRPLSEPERAALGATIAVAPR